MNSIPVSKERGLDPHQLACQVCGEHYGLTLGVIMRAYDEEGQVAYANRGQTAKCNKDREKHGLSYLTGWEEVKNTHEVLHMGICDACEENQQSIRTAVAEGGIYFKCSKCSITGAIKVDNPIAKAIREGAQIFAPDPIGVEFDDCSQHTPTEE